MRGLFSVFFVLAATLAPAMAAPTSDSSDLSGLAESISQLESGIVSSVEGSVSGLVSGASSLTTNANVAHGSASLPLSQPWFCF